MKEELIEQYELLEEVKNQIDKLPYPKKPHRAEIFCEKLKTLCNMKQKIEDKIKFLSNQILQWNQQN